MSSNGRVRFYKIKNWERFQHYGDRKPVWIKLHLSLADDQEFFALPDYLKVQLLSLWLFAGKNDEYVPDGDLRFLEKYNMSSKKFDLGALSEAGFLEFCGDKTPAIADASSLLADCYPDASVTRVPRDASYSCSKELKELEVLKIKGTEKNDVEEVYGCWLIERGRTDPRTTKRITPGRKAKITARLRDGFTVSELKSAIEGVRRDPWPDRALHDDITIILRSAEQTEKFIRLAGDVSVLSPEDRRQRHLDSLRKREAE